MNVLRVYVLRLLYSSLSHSSFHRIGWVLYILRRIFKIFFFPKDFIKKTLVLILILILKFSGGGKGMVERIYLT
jgi:hypothetical protein